jgi:hypothetical protein
MDLALRVKLLINAASFHVLAALPPASPEDSRFMLEARELNLFPRISFILRRTFTRWSMPDSHLF